MVETTALKKKYILSTGGMPFTMRTLSTICFIFVQLNQLITHSASHFHPIIGHPYREFKVTSHGGQLLKAWENHRHFVCKHGSLHTCISSYPAIQKQWGGFLSSSPI